VQYGKNVTVKLLISNWAHSDPYIFEQLLGLQQQGSVCSKKGAHPCGELEIRIYEVPGWNETTDFKGYEEGAADPLYPPFSRVAHGKYIVSDQRANIGTSNMAFSYFYSTAGSSFNTDDTVIVQNLEEAFLRDWDSDYSIGLNNWLARGQKLEWSEEEMYNNEDFYNRKGF
jgi:phospholipase D3/4